MFFSKSWGGIGRKMVPNNRYVGMKGEMHHAGSVTGSIVKSTGSSKKDSVRRSRNLTISIKNGLDDDARSIYSNRSNGTLKSKDGNWTSHSCQQLKSYKLNYLEINFGKKFRKYLIIS